MNKRITTAFFLVLSMVGGLSDEAAAQQAAGAGAQEALTRVSLDEALRLFSENNIELRLARSRAAEAQGLARQARAFPNPTADVTHEPISRNDLRFSETYFNVTQRFEVSGGRGARGEAADWFLVAAAEFVRADSVRLAFVVKRAYVEAEMAEDHLAVTEQAVDVFRQGERNAAAREAEGDISAYDLQRLRIERMRYENLLAEADLVASNARRELALLILPGASGVPADAGGVPSDIRGAFGTDRPEIGPSERIETSPEGLALDVALEAFQGTVARRPELAAAEAEVLAALANDRVARAVRIPDITATGGYKRQSDGFSGAFLGLSVPLPVFDRRSGDIEAAGTRVRAAEERRELTRRRIAADLRSTIESYRSLRDRRAFLENNRLADGPNILEIAQVAYNAGEMTLVELLDAAEALRDARMAETRLAAELWISFYDMERAQGGFDDAASRQTASSEIGR